MRGDALMTLFDGLARRVASQAGELANDKLTRAESLLSQLPDLLLRREGDTLVIEGIALMGRWISDIRLRFALWSKR
jgi:hypothetical protein